MIVFVHKKKKIKRLHQYSVQAGHVPVHQSCVCIKSPSQMASPLHPSLLTESGAHRCFLKGISKGTNLIHTGHLPVMNVPEVR